MCYTLSGRLGFLVSLIKEFESRLASEPKDNFINSLREKRWDRQAGHLGSC